LIKQLELSGTGCHVNEAYIGAILYADDVLLLSASIYGLQHMLDICYLYGLIK